MSEIPKNWKMPNPQQNKDWLVISAWSSSCPPPKICKALGTVGLVVHKRAVYFNKRKQCCGYFLCQSWKKKYVLHILDWILSLCADGYHPIWTSTKMAALRSLWIKEDNSYKQLHETKKLLRCKHFRSCWKPCLPTWVTMPLFSWKTQSKALCF